MVNDIIILLIPFPQIAKLQMNRRKKIAARDITWMMGPLFIWSSIEPSVAIVCACLPHLGPLARLTRIRILSSQGSKGNQLSFSRSPWQSSRRREISAHWQVGIRLSQTRHARSLSSTCGVAEDEIGFAIHGTAETTAERAPSLHSTSRKAPFQVTPSSSDPAWSNPSPITRPGSVAEYARHGQWRGTS
ncbi:hypothetical protein AbraIFM66950_000973 [Aspergillus brasiliensis]|nr:hypothetical protein AbraIFM66950_000973 [Aspergillus brasiliensis]